MMIKDICERLEKEIATWGGEMTPYPPPIVILLRDAKAEIARLQADYSLLSDDYKELVVSNERLKEE